MRPADAAALRALTRTLPRDHPHRLGLVPAHPHQPDWSDPMNDVDKMTFLRTVAESRRNELTDETFRPVLLSYNTNDDLTAVVNLEHDAENPDKSWAKITGAARVLCSAQEDLGAIVHVSDSYCLVDYDSMRTGPDGEPLRRDGSSWMPGTMAYAVAHQTEDAANVSDCLSICTASGERVSMASVPYSRTSIGWEGESVPMTVTFDWDEARVLTDEGHEQTRVSGNVPVMLRAALAAPKAADAMREQGIELPTSTSMFLEMAAGSIATHSGFSVALALPNDEPGTP